MSKSKPDHKAETKAKAKADNRHEVSDDDLKQVSGGMAAGAGRAAIPPVCVSSFGRE
jgi:hypothetical protein